MQVVEKSDAEQCLHREQVRAERERLLESMPPPLSNNVEHYYSDADEDENGDLDYEMSLSDDTSLIDWDGGDAEVDSVSILY